MRREARLGIARLGATRLGDYRPYVYLSVDGVARRLRIDHLTVRDTEGGIPNTATMRVSGFDPQEGQAVRLGLGALDAAHSIFAGHILKTSRIYEADNVENVAYDLTCISYEWRLNRHKVNARFMSQSATTIATSLIASYAPDFTVANVAAGLPSLEEFTLTNEDLTDALDRLTDRIGGAWYVDESKDLHLFLSETLTATAIDDTHRGASQVRWDRDLSPVRTRVVVEGGGSTALTSVVAGETMLPVEDSTWYEPSGGTVVSGPQRITYTGVQTGAGGGLVGPGAAPSGTPTLALAAGSGVESGSHGYAVTFVTAAGESIAGPTASITVGLTSAPGAAPTAGSATAGGSVDAGAHDYEVTFVTASGETTPGPTSNQVTATAALSTPSSAIGATSTLTAGSMATGHYWYITTFLSATGETEFSNAHVADFFVISGHSALDLNSIPTGPSGVTGRRVYRTFVDGPTGASAATDFWLLTTINNNTTTTYTDTKADGSLGGHPPTSNTTAAQTIPLTAIPLGGTLVTGRKLYRRFNGAGTYKLVTTIANNTATTYSDTAANASLGADAPSSNTATANQVALSAIPIGGASVTQRKIYRTTAGGSQLKLQSTIADNTTTTATDSTADASLGANVPTSDTSGLAQPAGQVTAGSTSLIIAGLSAFASGGGWAVIGNGQQVIRYTGLTSTALTGIPATGVGAIEASISYNSTVTPASALTGIPANGAGSILYDITTGDDVNLLVTVDDAGAQATLAALVGGDGVIEEYIQDRRLSSTEATARAQAQLDLVKDPLVSVRYETRDRHTRAGREVTFTSTLLGLTGTFKIQSVTISDFDGAQRTWPRRQVDASSRRFTFEALLRQGRA